MPYMDGIELAKLIRKSDKPDTPIIAISAYFQTMELEKGLFGSILNKPLNLPALKKVVELILKAKITT